MKRFLSFLFAILYFLTPTIADVGKAGTTNTESIQDTETGCVNELLQTDIDSLMSALYKPIFERQYKDSVTDELQYVSSTTHRLITENNHVPKSIEIDTSKEVGQIEIRSGTSQAGAKTYEVPINVYPGMHGFEPSLAISYDSHQGNTTLGKGWHIAGLPIISRTSRSLYYNNYSEGVSLNLNDAFSLDGMRLIYTGSSPEYISYETEFGNIKVNSYHSDDITKYFEVFYPNGTKGIFGFPDSNENNLTYPLTTLTDLHGNKIEYSYNHSGNLYRISKISYNGASVGFTYISNREDPILAYSGGLKMYEDCLLKEIICKLGSTIIGKYTLSYDYQKDNSNLHINALLSKIEYSCGGKSLNPLLFYYGTGSEDCSYSNEDTLLFNWYESEDRDRIKVVKGRFDYTTTDDGIILLPNANPYVKIQSGDNDYYINNYKDNEAIFLYTGLKNELALPMPDLETGKGFIDILCADLKGQQEEQIIKINNYVDNKKDKLVFKVYSSTFLNGLKNEYTHTYDMGYAFKDNNKHLSVQPKFHYTGDFNGDGKMEILTVPACAAFLSPSFPTTCHIFDLETGAILYKGVFFQFNVDFIGDKQKDPVAAANNSDKILILDYDGDGKSDICHINDFGLYVYTFDISGTSMTARKVASDLSFDKNDLRDKILLCGEFNGDGMMDLLISPSNKTESSVWDIYYSKGDGYFDKKSFECIKRHKSIKDGFVIQDIDGDGKTDLIQYNTDSFTTFITRNNVPSSATTLSFDEDSKNSVIVPTDINSHNNFSQLISLKDGTVTRYKFSYNSNLESLLTGMSNSLGVIEKNDYMLINYNDAESGYYIRGYDAVFPYVNILESIPVVFSTEKYHDGMLFEAGEYNYSNAVHHLQGKGFCGFGKIEHNGAGYNNWKREFDPYRFGLLLKESHPGYETSFDYSVNTLANKISRINLTKKIERDLLKGFSSTTTYKYDQYGYPTEEQTVYSDGSNGKNTYSYSNTTTVADGYNLGFVTDQTSTATRNGKTYSERIYIPARNKRLPNVQVYYKNGKQVKSQSYSYDTHGNVLKETIKRYSSQNIHTTSYTHDNYGRLTKVINPMEFTESFAYNDRGLLKSVTDYRGETTSFGYDEFGRQTSVSYPDSTVRNINYGWSSDVDGGLYYISHTYTGTPDSTKYYDAFNREIRISERRFDNSIKKIDKIYDTKGNLIEISEPYKGESASLWNSFRYDYFDRLEESRLASGKVTTYSYTNATATSNDGNKSVSRTYDIHGNLTSVTDPSGTVDYDYDADGQISSVVAYDDIVTTIDYDICRRKTGLIDPSLGHIKYSYDAAGNLASETNANGEVTSYEYDSFNRLTAKNNSELHTEYVYNDKNELVSISSDNGTSSSYKYDSHGRITESKETGVDGIWLEKSYTYSLGNVNSIKYTSQYGILATENYKYANGFLKEVVLNGKTSIFKISQENAYGQPTEIQTGKITRKYNFTDLGLPSKRQAYTSSKTVQNISYNFDNSTNNLLSRTDNTRNLTETFDYDNLDRLTSFNGVSAEYDATGNIIDKSDIGNFQYSISDKPYAISGVNQHGDAIPLSSQNVTYTSFSRPASISENNTTATFTYNAACDRVRMKIVTDDKIDLDRHYLGGCYELDKNKSKNIERLYLLGDYYSSPVVIVNNSIEAMRDTLIARPFEPAYPTTLGYDELTIPELGNTVPVYDERYGKHTYYILRDYLGNITHVVNSACALKQELSYDAWGRLRDPGTFETYLPGKEPTLYLGRGYTGHEHLLQFGLINMNARLYDPLLGRFLSPDMNIQNPDWIQNLNRYTYAMNNPLCYIDEDGELFWFIVGAAAVIGGVTNVINHWDAITSAGGWNGFWKGAGYFTIGAGAGGIGAALGVGAAVGFGSMLGVTATSLAGATTGFLPGFISGATTGMAEGMILRTSNSLMEGETLDNSLLNGLKGSFTDAIIGGISGGFSGGVKASNQGKNIWDGSAKKVYTGYFGFDADGVVRYVGITGRDPNIRFAEHLRSKTPRASLNYLPIDKFDSKIQVKIWEQTQINLYKMQKNGGQLFNKRNSLSPKFWEKYHIKP